jgi:hypothetical protein
MTLGLQQVANDAYLLFEHHLLKPSIFEHLPSVEEPTLHLSWY